MRKLDNEYTETTTPPRDRKEKDIQAEFEEEASTAPQSHPFQTARVQSSCYFCTRRREQRLDVWDGMGVSRPSSTSSFEYVHNVWIGHEAKNAEKTDRTFTGSKQERKAGLGLMGHGWGCFCSRRESRRREGRVGEDAGLAEEERQAKVDGLFALGSVFKFVV